MLAGLVLLIWLPLLLISVIGQTSVPNPPVEVDIKLSIGGFQVYLLCECMWLKVILCLSTASGAANCSR